MPPPRGTYNPLEGPGDYDMTTTIHCDTYPAIDPLKLNLHGKAVFISGASRGLGRVMAISFAKAGASQIVIVARSDLTAASSAIKEAAKEANRPDPEILCIRANLSKPEDVEAAAAQVQQQFGHLDIVVNNAAVMSMASITEHDPAEWMRILTINVFGPYLVARSLIPLLLNGGSKTIVNVASVGAHLVMPTCSAYQISKLAVVRLTEFISAEYENEGILSYCVHPGNVPTTDILGGVEAIPPELRHVFVEKAELSADSIAYLTSERRSWLAGRYVNLTWDLPQLSEKQEEIVKGDKLKVKLAI